MPTFILRHEWAREIGPETRVWWEEFARGLHALKLDTLQIKYTDKGFIRLKFHQVGISNSQVSTDRNHASIGYEHAKSTPMKKRRERFIPIIEEWIEEQTWGEATSEKDTKYREQLVSSPDCPSASSMVAHIQELLNRLGKAI